MSNGKLELSFELAGDSALIIKLGDAISPDIHKKVRGYYLAIKDGGLEGILDVIPTYTTVMIQYDVRILTHQQVLSFIEGLQPQEGSQASSRVIQIPTYYGNEYGMDLETVAKHNGLTVEEVIQIHSEPEYLIYMLGFTPGFPYLGGMDPRIATPRLTNPRQRIHQGSVGIAGNQTGIYPMATPGGWQIIGRTPLKLFDPERKEPTLLRAGDFLRFVPIELDEYRRLLKGGDTYGH